MNNEHNNIANDILKSIFLIFSEKAKLIDEVMFTLEFIEFSFATFVNVLI